MLADMRVRGLAGRGSRETGWAPLYFFLGALRLPWVAVGCSPYFGALYKEHRARGKKANIAIIIVARRMCRIVWQLLTENREFEEHRIENTTLSPAAPGYA